MTWISYKCGQCGGNVRPGAIKGHSAECPAADAFRRRRREYMREYMRKRMGWVRRYKSRWTETALTETWAERKARRQREREEPR